MQVGLLHPARLNKPTLRLLDREEGGGWVGELTYSYAVDGEYYSGFHHFWAASENDADSQVSGWKGQNVMIRYRPGNPSISKLRMEEQNKPLNLSFDTSWWTIVRRVFVRVTTRLN